MPRLYVFIDESRIPEDQSSPFFAGAVWCAPRPTVGTPKDLRPTVTGMKDVLQGAVGHRIHEIRYSHGTGAHAGDLLRMALVWVGRDDTISEWRTEVAGWTIAFTTAIVDRASESCILGRGGIAGRPDPNLGNIVRARAIATLLGPAIRCSRALELGVVMDGANWKTGVETYFGRCFNRLFADSTVTCQAEYCDSRRTPGLQVADLVAGTLRDFTTTGRCEDAFRMITAHTSYRL